MNVDASLLTRCSSLTNPMQFYIVDGSHLPAQTRLSHHFKFFRSFSFYVSKLALDLISISRLTDFDYINFTTICSAQLH